MRALQIVVLGFCLVVGGCANNDPAVIEGGPSRSQALRAVLSNIAIVPAGTDTSNISLEAKNCTKLGASMVQCTIRLYSVARGWSEPTVGQFMRSGSDNWMFSF